jgi:hypothetical protein
MGYCIEWIPLACGPRQGAICKADGIPHTDWRNEMQR